VLQGELEGLRDTRLPRAEGDLTRVQEALSGVQRLAEEVRDQRLPAVAARADALLEQIHEELTALSGFVERLAAKEPLRVEVVPRIEGAIPEAIRRASLRFSASLRGDSPEITGRVSEYLDRLREQGPVLDLGCGRGELLEVLRDAGIVARGVDSDPAMVAACRRRGLEAVEGDVLAELASTPAGTLGAVVAIHLVEHLAAASWMGLIESAAHALRPGGILIVESPNPETLRVGGGLFWLDPTHHAPVHPQAVALAAEAVGLEVVETRYMRPFPAEQALARPGQGDDLHELASRLDSWLSGPRDFVLIARKPGGGKAGVRKVATRRPAKK
jgi:SAM-dependent methyltransferase